MKANLANRPSIERIREVLAYDPITGVLTWRITSGRAIAGREAGGVDQWTGYHRVRVDGVPILSHHVVWAIVTGEWPEQLDHVDGAKDHYRFENLRECTQSQNMANVGRPNNNTSGIKGVTFHKASGLWRAQIEIEGKKKHLGCRLTREGAAELYTAAAANHYGEFARAEDFLIRVPRAAALKRKPGRPTVEEVRAVLSYDPATGLLRWKRALSFRGQIGAVAGRLNSDGYVRIGLFGRQYQAHILAWVIEMGVWPILIIHHADAVRNNNRWVNLSEITQSENVRAGYAHIRALTAPLYRRRKVA